MLHVIVTTRFHESGLGVCSLVCSLALDALGPVANAKGLAEQGSNRTRESATARILMTHVESLKKEMLCKFDPLTRALLV